MAHGVGDAGLLGLRPVFGVGGQGYPVSVVEFYVFGGEVLDGGDGGFFVVDFDVDVFEGDVFEGVAGVGFDGADAAEGAGDVGECDGADGAGGGFVALEVEVLGPGFDGDEGGFAVAGDVADREVFVELRGVGAELEAEEGDAFEFGAGDGAVFDEEVADDGGFAAEGDDALAVDEGAVVDVDVFDGRGEFVVAGEGAFRAFEGDVVVVDVVGAVFDFDVLGGVDVGAVGAGGGVAGFDVEAVDHNILAVVEVEVPEGRIEEVEVGDLDVFGVGDVEEARAGDVEVFGFVVGFVTGPEFGPEGFAGAVECAFARDAEMVAVFGVDEGGDPFLEVAFDAGLAFGEVGDVLGALEDGVFVEVEVDVGLEEESAGAEGAGGDVYRTAAGGSELVDGFLDGGGIEGFGVGEGAGVGDGENGFGEGGGGEKQEEGDGGFGDGHGGFLKGERAGEWTNRRAGEGVRGAGAVGFRFGNGAAEGGLGRGGRVDG